MNAWRWIAVDDRVTIGELARLYNRGLDVSSKSVGHLG
jgi:hypothetical protein